MATSHSPAASLSNAIEILRAHRVRWLIPAALFTVVALAYAVTKQPAWEASQALVVRDEAVGTKDRPGKFRAPDDMKTAQETILELAKSKGVLAAALSQVGPPAGHGNVRVWPTANDVESLANSLKLSPPKGAEFGRTEVFYLKVRDENQLRAIALATAVSEQLQHRFQELRDSQARGTVDELAKTVHLAEIELANATQPLTELETQVGIDLAELRILHESPSGDSDLRKTVIEIENELRQFRAAQQSQESLLQLLVASRNDEGRLLATPNRLLESQPALRRLKEGLVDAQLRTAQLEGTMSEAHPLVKAALAAEQEVSNDLHNELETAIHGLQIDVRLTNDHVLALETNLASSHERLSRLASLRTPYANLMAESRNRSEILKTAQQELAEARASQAAARTASFISAVDAPETGTTPVGPGTALIIAGGLLGGLLAGLGLVVLTVEPTHSNSDSVRHSRGIDEPWSSGQPSESPSAREPDVAVANQASLKQALKKILPNGFNHN